MFNWLLTIINKRLSKKYGWQPIWFLRKRFDKVLIKRIKAFQRKNKLFPSGICGKKTYRLVLLKVLLGIKQRKH